MMAMASSRGAAPNEPLSGPESAGPSRGASLSHCRIRYKTPGAAGAAAGRGVRANRAHVATKLTCPTRRRTGPDSAVAAISEKNPAAAAARLAGPLAGSLRQILKHIQLVCLFALPVGRPFGTRGALGNAPRDCQ